MEGEARSGDKQKIKDLEIIKKIKEGLAQNIFIVNMDEETTNQAAVMELNLLTSKKQIYLLNGKESDVSEELIRQLADKIKELGADYLIMDLATENNVNELIKKAYEILGLISFFTTGEDETKAWTIKKESKAPQAAGEIHSDFEKKFIRAEVINWQKLSEAGSWNSAKQKGWLKLEGKDYIVQNGDVMVIRHG